MKWGSRKNLLRMGFVFGMIVILLIASTASHIIISNMKRPELEEKYQSCVYLGTECINTYQSGEGEKTIVIIPDFDVLVPSIEYRPLVDELSLDYNVLVVEPFGKGFSDVSDTKRTLENVVDELHRSIHLSGVEEPYILMTSGYGSLYAQEYLNLYKDEVEVYVAIDPVPVTQVNHVRYRAVSAFSGLLENLGLIRYASTILPDLIAPTRHLENYSSSQEEAMFEIGKQIYGNKNIVEESRMINDVMVNLQSSKLPFDVPTLVFVPKGDIIKYDWWLEEQENMIAHIEVNKMRISNHSKFMHREAYHEIAIYTTNFINSLKYED